MHNYENINDSIVIDPMLSRAYTRRSSYVEYFVLRDILI